jgi:hypothetical protein
MNCQAFLHDRVLLSAIQDIAQAAGAPTASRLPIRTKEAECETFEAFAVGGSHGTQASGTFIQTGGGATIVFPS